MAGPTPDAFEVLQAAERDLVEAESTWTDEMCNVQELMLHLIVLKRTGRGSGDTHTCAGVVCFFFFSCSLTVF